MHRAVLLAAILLSGCSSEGTPPARDAGAGGDGGSIDAPSSAGDAPRIDASSASSAIAPDGTIPGEIATADESVPVEASPTEPVVVRIEAGPNEHVTVFLTFAPEDAAAELEVLRWDGAEAVHLGTTDAGPGLRTLAVFDPSGPRTFWARITTTEAALAATLTITRVPFEDAATCPEDCAHLLQLPLPNDLADGYRATSGTVFRYQYGRRDLVMFIRHAGHRITELGMSSFVPQDLSQWNGETPGTDVGAPRHASHQRGKDVDISLYGLDGESTWRSYCDAVATTDGRECTAGSEHDFDGALNAIFFGDFLATGRVTMSFLDQELHPPLFAGAESAAADGTIDPSVVPLFSDGVHVQHWPNHDNHIHIRVSEAADGASAFRLDLGPEPFEPP